MDTVINNSTNSKAVLITGCSSGIGLCVAQGLQKHGYRVFATARKHEDVTRLHELGLESLHLDLNDTLSMQNAIKKIMHLTEGKLYALFNNAAYAQPGAVEDIPTDALRKEFETNVFGWHELTRMVIPIMRQQGYGRIIQNSSVLGLIALKFRGAYVASKYAIEGLSDTLRQELMGTDIHVSLVEPGPIESQFRANSFEQYKKHINKDNSHFKTSYEAMEKRLTTIGPAVPFTLPPEAVLKKVLHALQSKKPKARYYVTVPTYLFGYLKRLLSTRLMDRLLSKV